MIIKSIKLNNFRQYKGENVVNFSTDPDKNVTVILGVNTSGKTTLIQAFNWCLYGETSFKVKDLLNIDIARGLTYNTCVVVCVEICLIHDGKEYTIKRSQKFVGNSNSKAKVDKASLSVSYKDINGNSYMINDAECESAINEILPNGLSDYFFFDGERIQDIGKKKDVAGAVRGLMGLDIISAAVDHLNPNDSRSVIGKLRAELKDEDGNQYTSIQRNLVDMQKKLDASKRNSADAREQIRLLEDRDSELTGQLNSVAAIRGQQLRRTELQNDVESLKKTQQEGQDRLISDFNNGYFTLFVQPLIRKARGVIKNSKEPLDGIPEMDSKSIDYILKRGRCICGCDLTCNQGAVNRIMAERELLPPHQIGAMVTSFNEDCDRCRNEYATNPIADQIQEDLKSFRRTKATIRDKQRELDIISDKIKETGPVDVQKMETDFNDNRRNLNNMYSQKAKYEAEIKYYEREMRSSAATLSDLSKTNKQNDLTNRKIRYAEELYRWFKKAYDDKEAEVKQELLQMVNDIFKSMYHGSRRVNIDDQYRITLSLAEENESPEESKGLEAVKNFAFICGLVALARKKAREKNPNAADIDSTDDLYSSEPYPIVMDAPFSNVDEIHISKISSIMPSIAEQVILIIMRKDWNYTSEEMRNCVGAEYEINKLDETYSKIVKIK